MCSLLRFLGKKGLADRLESAHSKVIGEFVCDRIHEFKVFEDGSVQDWYFGGLNKSCLTRREIAEYIGRENYGYSWHISDLVIYDKPRELSKFYKKAPCQYWHEKAVSILDHCHYDYPCEKILDFDTCKGKKLSRPPQSWCYVEGT